MAGMSGPSAVYLLETSWRTDPETASFTVDGGEDVESQNEDGSTLRVDGRDTRALHGTPRS